MSEVKTLESKRLSTIANDVTEIIGETPMVWLKHDDPTVKARIALKLESENPMKSVKDRLGLGIIEKAEKAGEITPGKTTLIEATSGNTGIALAHIGRLKGYRVIIVMPETMSQERRCLLRILGAELVLTPASKGLKAAVFWANKLTQEIPDAYLASQFETKYNAQIHYETTGPEIWSQTQGKLDYFIAGVGTGGTLCGSMQYFKDQGSNVKCVAVEPKESAVLSGNAPGPHKIQGIGAGFVPKVLEPYRDQISEILPIPTEDALAVARKMPVMSGIFCGISSGAIVSAAMEIGRRPEAEGKIIVAMIPSFGERYLTTALFDNVRQECLNLPVLDAGNFP
eukprot:PhM_4_TR2045/c1_g2_i1/m.95485/K01738/cysK; cysteine synthase A